jgi:hypothetical protein
MKKYELLIITGTGLHPLDVYADHFFTETLYYRFVSFGNAVGCYPINRTIIRKVSTVDESDGNDFNAAIINE